ncbi:MAG: winged helix-turn-helix domain-containing protein [Nitrososphaera sp.]
MKYRSRTDIAAAILEIALDGAIKTKIMYKAFLSFPQLKEYLGLLEERGLLLHVVGDQEYRTTDKGKEFLKMYKDIGQIMFPPNYSKKPTALQKG